MSNQIPKGTDVDGDMTPEAQRIATAEACGWARNGSSGNDEYPWVKPVNGVAKSLPDYLNDLNDLNAMNEAECTLDGDQWDIYCTILESMDGPAIGAVAWRRAEAFLKTLNLYK